MNKFLYVCFGLLLILFRSYAFHHTRDSLDALLHIQLGKDRLNTLIELSDHITYSSPAEAIRLANEAIRLAENLDEKKLRLKALKVRGYANGYAGNILQSVYDMQEGLEQYSIENDSVKIAEALSDLGYLYQSQGAYDKALRNFQQSLSIREKIRDQKGIAYSLNNIGALYWELGKADEALDYHLRAIAFFKENNMEEETGIATANLGEIYLIKEEYDKALDFFNQALALNRKLGHHIFEANNLNSIGSVYLKKNEPGKAFRFFSRAVVIQEKAGDKNGLALSHYQLGLTYQMQNLLNEALHHFSISSSFADTIHGNDLLVKSLVHAAAINNQSGNYKIAYEELNRAKQLNDSIFNLERTRQFEELKARYETERHILENKNLRQGNINNNIIISQQRIMLIMTIILSLLIVLMVWLFLQKRRSADRLNALELEQKLLRSQMNPHFVFNTLTAIQNNILQKTVREGVNLISSLASLMRLTLDNSANEFIPFEKELQSLRLYLMLQQERYNDHFDFQTEVDPRIKENDFWLPPMLTQPFVENAIEHGFCGINYKGIISITYLLVEKGILCEITDNGIGYHSGMNKQKENCNHHSYGIDITRQRIKILRNKYRLDARIDISDLSTQNLSGTRVTILMPIKQL